jgi:(1->4)-alpha-D-glucan 1-alpha-D-glucosylmutase
VVDALQGAERLRAAWVEQTGGQARFHDALSIAKGDVIRRDLAAELLRLITLARNALDDAATFEAGDEALREAGIAPMTAFPRYRSYFTRNDPPVDDLALMAIVADFAGRGLRTPAVVNKIALMISAPATGALLAKAHEDTAGFRRTPILAACEVGADFDCPALTAKAMQDWARAQPGTDLILTSSHDTKRSKDARACLITWTHLLGGALALIDRAAALPAAQKVPGNVLLYLMQSVMAIWVPDDGDLGTRLAEHITKALREADEITSWTHPVETTEAAVQTLLAAMIAGGRAAPPDALARLIARGEGLALTQLALKLVLPGIPDFYRGCEGLHLVLTDPDNRRPVEAEDMGAMVSAQGLAGRNARLTQRMLGLCAYGARTVLARRHGCRARFGGWGRDQAQWRRRPGRAAAVDAPA